MLAGATIDHPVMLERAALLRERLPALAESEDEADDLMGSLEALHEAAKVQGAGGKKAWGYENDYEAFKLAAERLRKEIKEALSLGAFDRAAARDAAETSLRLLRLAAQAGERYAASKRDLQMLDFDDELAHGRPHHTTFGGARQLLASSLTPHSPLPRFTLYALRSTAAPSTLDPRSAPSAASGSLASPSSLPGRVSKPSRSERSTMTGRSPS